MNAAILRQSVYIIIAVSSLIWVWWHGIGWIQEGGNIANPLTFFVDAYVSGHAAAFLTIDILAVWIAFIVWVLYDTIKIGLGLKIGILFVALSYAGTCFAFPLYLVVRERYLARVAAPATA